MEIVKYDSPEDKSGIASESYTSASPDMEDPSLKVGQLIRERRRALGLTQTQLGNLVGVTKAAISSIERGQTVSLRGATLVGLSNVLGFDAPVLEGKRVAGLPKQAQSALAGGQVGPRTNKNRVVRVVGTATVDSLGGWSDVKVAAAGTELIFDSADPLSYAIRISGDAFHPRVKSGELLVMEPSRPVEAGDEVLVTLLDGRSLLRELAYHRDGQYALNGINGQPRLTVPEDNVQAVHFVAAIVKPSRLVGEA